MIITGYLRLFECRESFQWKNCVWQEDKKEFMDIFG